MLSDKSNPKAPKSHTKALTAVVLWVCTVWGTHSKVLCAYYIYNYQELNQFSGIMSYDDAFETCCVIIIYDVSFYIANIVIATCFFNSL